MSKAFILLASSMVLLTCTPTIDAFTFLTTSRRAEVAAVRSQRPAISRTIPVHSRSGTCLKMAEMSTKDVSKSSEEKMKKSIESVMKNLNSIRTGRANAAILDRVMVTYYGAPTPLNQMASISVSSAQQLTVEPYDKSIMGDIERGIVDAELGLSPNNDGSVIRINIPALTEARRKDLLKQCKSYGEEGKVALRNVRRDGVESIKKMEKSSEISKDQAKDGTDEMQKICDKYIKEIDGIVAKKEKEIMTV